MKSLTFANKDEWASFHDGFVAGTSIALDRFHRRMSQHPQVVADRSVESLGPIGDWFLRELVNPQPPTETPLPVWWESDEPWAGTGTRHDLPFTREQIIFIDEVQSYFADVLIQNYPGARWVIFKGLRRETRRGKTLLQLGDKDWPVQTVGTIYKPALIAVEDHVMQPHNWLETEALSEMSR